MTIREIVDLFVALERQLVFSLKRNLKNHHAWEKEEGFSWPAWQAEKIRSIEAYRRQNKRIVEVYEPFITQETANLLREQYAEGYEQESDFLDHLAAEELPELSLPRATAEPPGTEGFFKVNHEKLDRLIDDIGGSLRAANHSTLRLMDDVYRKTIAKVEIALSTGAVTPWQAVDMAIKDFLSQGINSITYQNGARVNIASYAEMALRTAATRAQLRGEAMKRQERGIDTVRVSQYGACSKTCLPWQGRVYIDDVWGVFEGERDDRGRGRSRDGSWYPLLSTALSGGLFHPNCKHTLTSYIKGISRDVPIMDEESCLRVSKLEQKQRRMERQVRALKRLQDGSTDPQNIKNYARKSKLAQKKLREFIAENGDVLRRSPEREKNRLRGENSPEFQEKALRNDGDGGIIETKGDGQMLQVKTDGIRNERPLTLDEQQMVIDYAVHLGMPVEQIYYVDYDCTGYGSMFDLLRIGTDVFPADTHSPNPNSNVSMHAAIAHEIIGHREAALKAKTHSDDFCEEAQASIRAARFAPDLSYSERITLLRDGINRLRRNGLRLKDVKQSLYINER